MQNKKLKVFHGLVNYGTQAGLFASALREAGIDALSVSYPDPFKRLIDIELLHGGNIIQKIFRHSWNWLRRFYWFFRYNTFHFYFGTSLFPKQMDLPLYRLFGKKVIMEYLGFDAQIFQKTLDKYSVNNLMLYKLPPDIKTTDSRKMARLRREARYVDLQLVCAPDESEWVENSQVLPLAIDISKIPFSPRSGKKNIIEIMHAPTSRAKKGTKFIQEAVEKLQQEGFKINLTIVQNVTHEKLMKKYKECDIFIEQLLGGWYGTSAIEAMATGRPVICFLREEYFTYIDYARKIPVINADPFSLYSVLKSVINHPEKLDEIALRSRKYVEEIHDVRILVKKLENIYRNC